jgi:hypothetical protein
VDLLLIQNSIYSSFSGDTELFSKFHALSPCQEKEGIEDTVNSVLEWLESGTCKFLATQENGRLTGYILYSETMLHSFGIVPMFRTKEYQATFFQVIKNCFNNSTFVCPIHTKNTRAIKWFSRMGCTISSHNKDITLCQLQ